MSLVFGFRLLMLKINPKVVTAQETYVVYTWEARRDRKPIRTPGRPRGLHTGTCSRVAALQYN